METESFHGEAFALNVFRNRTLNVLVSLSTLVVSTRQRRVNLGRLFKAGSDVASHERRVATLEFIRRYVTRYKSPLSRR